jgi:hypothetical protein
MITEETGPASLDAERLGGFTLIGRLLRSSHHDTRAAAALVLAIQTATVHEWR